MPSEFISSMNWLTEINKIDFFSPLTPTAGHGYKHYTFESTKEQPYYPTKDPIDYHSQKLVNTKSLQIIEQTC